MYTIQMNFIRQSFFEEKSWRCRILRRKTAGRAASCGGKQLDVPHPAADVG
jgi:hypothetical protein